MRRKLLIACVCTALAAAGAFVAGRSTREEPPAPVSPATAVDVEAIDIQEWQVEKTSLPSLVLP